MMVYSSCTEGTLKAFKGVMNAYSYKEGTRKVEVTNRAYGLYIEVTQKLVKGQKKGYTKGILKAY